MWLIDTSTRALREFTRSTPPYVALSHDTEENEVPLENPGDTRREVREKSNKIVERACGQARTAGIAYLWNYTTCVDKHSWAAQSEAINSMAQIYRGCEYTIIYLADLVSKLAGNVSLGERLARCRWFKDIWAIPQIVFSRAAYFFSSDWTQIGTKISLLPVISSILGIDQPVLEDPDCLDDYSIARRMSWASEMTTSRIEDSAYALLGVFNISLPIIYGEGEKAFFKLQEEIVKDTNDFSLLAWDNLGPQEYTGGFAHSPACFRPFRNGITTTLRINGEVTIHCGGITIETLLWETGTGLFLPLESEDGSICSVPLISWDGYFVRKGSRVEWNVPGRKSAEVVRFCLKRNVSARFSRKISACEGNVSEEPFHSVEPRDDISRTKGSQFPNRNCNYKDWTGIKAPAFETGHQMASQYPPSVSTRVSSNEDIITGLGVSGCSAHEYEQLHPVELRPAVVAEEAEQTMMPGVGFAPAYTVSRAVPSAAVSPDGDDRHYKVDSSSISTTRSGFDSHARPSGAQESTSEAHHVSERGPVGDPEKDNFRSSCSRPGGLQLSVGPQTSISKSGLPPAEVQDLDVASITKELADIAADRFLSRRHGEISKRSFIPWQTQSRKRAKRANSFDQLEHVYTSDSDDGETVLIKKTRFFACPFYVRNSQYTECLRTHHFDSIEDVKEHICWDHRRPKYCPVCKEEFSSGRDRDAHIRLRTCNANALPPPDGITDDQEEGLEREDGSTMSEDTRWYQIWDVVFPQTPRPLSAFYTSERDVSVCAFRQSWLESGENVIAGFLEAKEYQSYSIQNEERNLRTIHDLVMENVLDKIFNDFGDTPQCQHSIGSDSCLVKS